jgi:hypothetical protein
MHQKMAQYEINDLVMVKDRGKIYEAKIINAQSFNEVWHYFVHFQGWNKKWDRWTDESEISKKTENVGRNGQRDGSEEEIVTTGTKVHHSFLYSQHIFREAEITGNQCLRKNDANSLKKKIL